MMAPAPPMPPLQQQQQQQHFRHQQQQLLHVQAQESYGEAEASESSDAEADGRAWEFGEPRSGTEGGGSSSSSLAEPIGSVARAGQLGSPLGIAHLALGAVAAAMSAYSSSSTSSATSARQPGGGNSKSEGDGLPRVRMLSCLHALFTQLHDPERLQNAGGEAEEYGRNPSGGFPALHRGPPLDHSDLDVLEKAVRILHLRYRSCLRPLTRGRLPSATELKELRTSAEALGARATVLCIDKVLKGDRRRLPLFAFRSFALRTELDAEALRLLQEPTGPEWDTAAYVVSTSRLRCLLEDMAEEVGALWEGAGAQARTLFDAGTVLAPVLAQYSLLGKALRLALQQFKARLTVRKHGRVVHAVGDEMIVWDDGLDGLRELFHPGRGYPERPLGPILRVESMQDYSWFISWSGTSAVDNIPAEVPVKKVLVGLGAPPALAGILRASDKPLLMSVALPELRAEAERKIVAELHWAVAMGAKFEIRAGKAGPGAPVSPDDAGAMAFGAPWGYGDPDSDRAPSDRDGDFVHRRGGVPQQRRNSADGVLDVPTPAVLEPAQLLKYDVLVEATREWAEDLKLGEGGSAIVYKGASPMGQWWAVKRGKKGGLTRRKDYEEEVAAVSQLSHPNLVRLLGFCDENEEQVLVYEYVPNGTLREHLNAPAGMGKESNLSFEKRLDIALGVAEGLLYLHNSTPTLVHRDVKSLNVFLDNDYQPKLGDFGSLKPVGDDPSQMLTRVVGTPGYLDPQYVQTSMVSDRSDVYSFGVVLLELITGKPPVMKEGEDGNGDRMALAKWATPAICSGNTESVVDPLLPPQGVSSAAMQALASLAAMCVQRQPKDRPSMAEVTRKLRSIRAQAVVPSTMTGTPPTLQGPRPVSTKESRSRRHSPSPSRMSPAHAMSAQLSHSGGASGSGERMGSWYAPGSSQGGGMDSPGGGSGGERGGGSGPPAHAQGGAALGPGKTLFNKEFWRPKRTPTRSLSDASMQDIADAVGEEMDASLGSPPDESSGGASHGNGGERHYYDQQQQALLHQQQQQVHQGLQHQGQPMSTQQFHSSGPRQQSMSGPRYNSGPQMGPGGYGSSAPNGTAAPGLHFGGLNISVTSEVSSSSRSLLQLKSNSSTEKEREKDRERRRDGSIVGGGVPISGPVTAVAALGMGPRSSSSPGKFSRRSRGQKEAVAALGKLKHANVAAVLGFSSERDADSLTYDLPTCTPLASYLRAGEQSGAPSEELPLRLRLKVAVGVARGLHFLHSNGVVHGSLTAQTVMIDRSYTVLLTGYGQEFIQQNKNKKTPLGMSPGSMSQDTLDYGLMLYELLTGRQRCALGPDASVAEAVQMWAEPFVGALERSLKAGRGGQQQEQQMGEDSAQQEDKRPVVVRMLKVLAEECVQDDPHCRPSMKDLLVRLQGLHEMLTQ